MIIQHHQHYYYYYYLFDVKYENLLMQCTATVQRIQRYKTDELLKVTQEDEL